MEHGNSDFSLLTKKAFEVSYALFRLSERMDNRNFAAHLEVYGLELLSSALRENFVAAKSALTAIEYFTRLGMEANAISAQNGNVLASETANLHSAIAAFESSRKLPDIDISTVFSSRARGSGKGVKVLKAAERKGSAIDKIKYGKRGRVVGEEEAIEIGNHMSEEGVGNPAIAGLPAQTRQSAILNIVGQYAECRLKDILRDIQEFFPEVSERTIRYDMQKMLDQGIIERIGVGGGPATYYQVSGSAKVIPEGQKTLEEVEI